MSRLCASLALWRTRSLRISRHVPRPCLHRAHRARSWQVDLYAHSGGFIDYMYDEFSVLGYTYEGSSILGGCHVQPPAAIVPSSAEQWAGVLEVAKHAFAKSRKLAAAL